MVNERPTRRAGARRIRRRQRFPPGRRAAGRGSTVGESLKPVPLSGGQVDLYIDPRVFHPNFAADLPAEEAAVLALTQRPATGAALGEPAAGTQAWHTIPAW